MPGVFIFLFLLVFVALVVWLGVSGEKATLKAEADFLAWSQARGMQYRPYGEKKGKTFPLRTSIHEIQEFYGDIKGLHAGNGRFYHLFRGEVEGIPFESFQYQYTVSSGKSSHTYYYRVYSLICDVDAPEFELGPSSVFDFFKDLFGTSDTNLGMLEFDNAFRLITEDEVGAKLFFNPYLADFLRENFHFRLLRLPDRFTVIEYGRLDVDRVEWAMQFFHRFWDEIDPSLKSLSVGTDAMSPGLGERERHNLAE